MKINFEKVIVPCVVNDVTLWHAEHGWLWDVVEAQSSRHVAVFFCTLLCGDGCIVHFDTVPGMVIPWQSTLAAMRKGVRIVVPLCKVVYATIPADNLPLIRCAVLLGFVLTDGGFFRDGRKIELLKYFHSSKAILRVKNTSIGYDINHN